MANKKTTSSHSLPVRILALALSLLVASGILVYLVTFVLSLFGL